MQRKRAIVVFLIITILASIPVLWAIIAQGKFELHIAVHRYYDPIADTFFSYATHLADGWTVVVLAVFMLYALTWRSFLMLALTSTFSSIVVQMLKHTFFETSDRPSMYRDALSSIHWVDGVELHAHNSFPSGHSAAAFSMCFALAVIIGKKSWAGLLALAAILLAYSRVYLSQHFTEDAFVGSWIGLLTGLLMYAILYRGSLNTSTTLDRRPFRSTRA